MSGRRVRGEIQNIGIREQMNAIIKVHCIKGGYIAAQCCSFPLTLIDLLLTTEVVQHVLYPFTALLFLKVRSYLDMVQIIMIFKFCLQTYATRSSNYLLISFCQMEFQPTTVLSFVKLSLSNFCKTVLHCLTYLLMYLPMNIT